METKQARFAGAYLQTMDPAAAAAAIGEEDGVRLLDAPKFADAVAARRAAMRREICMEDLVRRLTQLCFGSANDCVRLALDPAAGPEGLDLGQLAEIKRTEKGAVEIKLIDRLQAQLRVWVVSPVARTGETFAERVCDVLLGAQSVSVTQISRGETAYDGTLECFLTDLDLTVSALLIAAEESDDGVFTDFILKGAIA